MRQVVRTGVGVVLLVTAALAVGWAQGPTRPPRPDPRGRDACKAGTPSVPACVKGLTTDLDAVFEHLGSVSDSLENLRGAIDAEQALRRQQEARVAALEKRTPPDTAQLSARLAALESQIATLRNEGAGSKTRSPASTTPHRVTAPFEVVDASGALLLHVGPSTTPARADGLHIDRSEGIPYVSIFHGGHPVAQMRGTAGGGGRLALARPGDQGSRVFLDAMESQVAVTDGRGMVLATMLAGTTEGPVVGVLAPDGNTLAGIGSNGNGGRVFANFKDNSMAFKAGAQAGGDADACVVSSKRGLQCLRVRLY